MLYPDKTAFGIRWGGGEYQKTNSGFPVNSQEHYWPLYCVYLWKRTSLHEEQWRMDDENTQNTVNLSALLPPFVKNWQHGDSSFLAPSSSKGTGGLSKTKGEDASPSVMCQRDSDRGRIPWRVIGGGIEGQIPPQQPPGTRLLSGGSWSPHLSD